MAQKFFNIHSVIQAWFAGRPGVPVSSADQFDTAFPNNRALYWRNAANSAEVSVLKLNASDVVEIGNNPTLADSNGNEVIKTATTTSAVNEVTFTNAATGQDPQIAATGGDTNIDLQLAGKGTGLVLLGGYGGVVATAGAATATTQRGYVTTESLTTAAAAKYTLTLTNAKIAASSFVVVGVENGTNTQGIPVVATVKVPAAGSVVIDVYNLHATVALNGTLLISFAIL